MARPYDELAGAPMPPMAGRQSAAARHPARRREGDALLAAPRLARGGPAPLAIGGAPPFLKALAGPAALRGLPSPGPAAAVPAGVAPVSGAALALSAPPTPLALPKPAGAPALPPGTGQIDLGMDADAGLRTVPRGAPGAPAEPAPRGYEGVNWGPQNPRPGPEEMGAMMGATDRLNQARSATEAAAQAAQQPAPAAQPGEAATALSVLGALGQMARGAGGRMAGGVGVGQQAKRVFAPSFADLDRRARAAGLTVPGPITQDDLLAALPYQHEEILARDAAVPPGNPADWTPQAIHDRAAAEAQQAAAEKAASATGSAAKAGGAGAGDALAVPPYPGGKNFPARAPEAGGGAGTSAGPERTADSFAWEGGQAPQMTGARQRLDGGTIKPMMTDQDMADYRAMLAQPPVAGAGAGERVGIKGAVNEQPFGFATSTAAGPVSDESKAGMQRVMEGLQSGRYGITPEAIEKGRAWDEARTAETLVKNEQSRVDNHNRAAVLTALEYRDPLARAAMVRAALQGMQGQSADADRVVAAGQGPAAQKTAQAQLEAGVEQKRLEAEGRVAEKQAEARKPVTMKYKVGGKRPGDDPLDQEVLVDPLTQQPVFDTGSLMADGGGEHPFGAFEERAAEWDQMAKKKGYASGQAAYQAAVQAWMSKYGQGT